MKVIVTGGTGLIGRALVQALVSGQHEVVVLSRAPQRAVLPAGAVAVAWDGGTAQGWGAQVEGADAIVNLAGESVAGESLLALRWTPERKQRILQSRVNAGAAVAEAIRIAAHKPAVLVQASAVGFYGPRPDLRVTETTPPGRDFLAQVCQAWEASTAPVEAWGVRRVILRIGIVLAAAGGALPRQLLPFRLFVGGPIGSGCQGYPWIHLADVVGAIDFLLQNSQTRGAYNICAPSPLTNAEFGRTLARVLRRPYWLPAPAWAFRWVFGEAAAILLDGQRAYPQRLLEAGYAFRYPEAEAALRDLLAKGDEA